MAAIDIVFLVAYFVGVAAIGDRSSHKSLASSKSYFLDGGSISWVASGASLFASNLSAQRSIRFGDREASSDLAVGQFKWIGSIGLLLGWFFMPVYLRSQSTYCAEVCERSK